MLEYFRENIEEPTRELTTLMNSPLLYEALPAAYESCEYCGELLMAEDVYALASDRVVFCNRQHRTRYMKEIKEFGRDV